MKNSLILINNKIKKAKKIYGNEKEINLIAVSKKFGEEKILEAISLECNIFGENYINEAQEKWPKVKEKYPEIKLHFIGHLQSNKAKEAVELFDVIQTLDRKKLALALKKEMKKQDKYPQLFIQVNIGQEEQKSGILPSELDEFIEFCKKEDLKIFGLMCIPPENENPAPYFALLNKFARKNNIKNLSMGMSSDFEEAIACGTNYVRIGTAIFGKREV
jgi:hypothetical protein